MKKYLVPGAESLKRIESIFKLTKIRSEDIREAIIDHLVKGHAEKTAVALNGVDQSNFNRALARLNEAAEVIEEIKEDDWPGYRYQVKSAGLEEAHY